MVMDSAILTIPEVAEFLKMSQTKVYAMAVKGELPHIRIGKNVRVRAKDLQDWLDTKAVGNP